MLRNLNENLKKIKDNVLLAHFSQAVGKEKEALALVILHLSEISRRRLFAKEGYSSLYAYLREKYHYSEGGAYRRIQAARLSQRHPKIISYLKSGKLNLMIISLIAPYMTPENEDLLMRETMEKSKQKIELLLAERYGKKRETVRDEIRRLPVGLTPKPETNLFANNVGTAAVGGDVCDASPKKPATSLEMSRGFLGRSEKQAIGHSQVQTRSEERRVKIVFGAKEQVAQKLKRVQEILKHKYPAGKLEDIMDDVLDVFLEAKDPNRKLFRRKSAQTNQIKTIQKKKTQASKSKPITQHEKVSNIVKRYIPAEIRRRVWMRDEGRCQYQSRKGKKCEIRGGLELDHIAPFALGGKHTVDNLRLLCMQHNRLRSFQTFGQEAFSVSK